MASAVFVGMAGAVYGYYLAFVDPRGMFNILLSVQILLSMLLGGRGTLWGPVLGAFLIEGLNESANNELGGGNSRLLMFGGLMALVVLFLPRGILPSVGERLEARAHAGKAGLVGAAGPGSICASATAPAGGPPVGGPPLLEVKDLEKRFGGLRAVDGCLVRGARGLDHGADRPQRLGQDDGLQPDRRDDDAGRRRGLVRRASGSTGCGRGGAPTSGSGAPSRSRACSGR